MANMVVSRRAFSKLMATAAATVATSSLVTGHALGEETAEQAASAAEGAKKIRSCCRGCGKSECGVWVYVKDGRVIRTEGDDSCFSTMGSHCSKGQASIQACYHPDRIKYPMKRTNPKGEDDPGWVRISWEEAYQTIADNCMQIREKYGPESLFSWCGTGRQWCMQSDAGMALQLFGSPNVVAAYQVCKGPRHFSSALDNVEAWSWSDVDAHRPVLVQWATEQSISNYDDSARMITDVARAADTYISVDPRKTNLGSKADYWLNLRPGTDAALALGWCKVVLDHDLVDWKFIKRWSNAPFMVVMDKEPAGYGRVTQRYSSPWDFKTRLISEADIDPKMVDWEIEGDGNPMRYIVWDTINQRWTYWQADPTDAHWEGETWTPQTEGRMEDTSNACYDAVAGWIADLSDFNPLIDPAVNGEFEVTLKDGSVHTARPVWDIWCEYLEQWDLAHTAEVTGVDAEKIEAACLAWATRVEPDIPNAGINYGLGVEHAGNSTQNCRAIMAACAMVGAIDTPGGQRGATIGWTDAGDMCAVLLPGPDSFKNMPSPELFNRMAGNEKMPLLNWYQVWADANAVMECAHREPDAPYEIHGGMIGSGDHMNMANATYNWEALNMLDFCFEANLWHSATSGCSDILLPVCHWLEMNTWRVSQGSQGAFGLGCRAVEPPGECKSDPLYFMELSKYFDVHAFYDADDPWLEKSGADKEIAYLENWLFGPSCSVPFSSWQELYDAFQEHGWWNMKEMVPEDWGTFRRFETGQAYRPGMHQQPYMGQINIPGFVTPTMKHEFWNTTIESFYPNGEAGPELAAGFTSEALPYYQEPEHGPVADAETYEEYPITCITGRRIPVYFHSEHRQLPWCRELWPVPRMEINPVTADELGLKQGDWAWIESPWGKVRQTVDLYYGIAPGTINCEHQWWYPEFADQAGGGFELSCINCITDRKCQDRYNGSATVRTYPVKVYKATAENSPFGNPVPCDHQGNEIITSPDDPRLKAWQIGGPGVCPDNF